MRTPHSSIRSIVFLLTSIFLLAAGCNNTQTSTDSSRTPSAHSPAVPTVNANVTLHPTHTVTIGEHTFNVQIAKTEPEQMHGLSGIQSMRNNEGMLFLFNPPREPAFWMKDMLFPIDIIWIKNNAVVAISEQLPTPGAKQDSELPLYIPPTTIDAALEVNAGLTKLYNVHVGDVVSTQLVTK